MLKHLKAILACKNWIQANLFWSVLHLWRNDEMMKINVKREPSACMWNTCRQSFCSSIFTYSENRTKKVTQHKGPVWLIWTSSLPSVTAFRFSLTSSRTKNGPCPTQTRPLCRHTIHVKGLGFKIETVLYIAFLNSWLNRFELKSFHLPKPLPPIAPRYPAAPSP